MHAVEIVGLVASPAHRYGGRPGTPVSEQSGDRRADIEVRAGHGIVGDRYAGQAAHRDAAVTVLAAESVEALVAELGSGPLDPLLARRNVVLRGAEVEALRGHEFSLDCGEGEVVLRGQPAGEPVRVAGRRLGAGCAPRSPWPERDPLRRTHRRRPPDRSRRSALPRRPRRRPGGRRRAPAPPASGLTTTHAPVDLSEAAGG